MGAFGANYRWTRTPVRGSKKASAFDMSLEGDNITTVRAGNVLSVKTGGISTSQLANEAVQSAKIADLAVTSGKIANNAITNDKIDDTAVNAAKIVNNAITTNKIQSAAITEDKISPGAVTGACIATAAVTAKKLSTDSVDDSTLERAANGDEFVLQIKDAGITGAKIADGTITRSKLADDLTRIFGNDFDEVGNDDSGDWMTSGYNEIIITSGTLEAGDRIHIIAVAEASQDNCYLGLGAINYNSDPLVLDGDVLLPGGTIWSSAKLGTSYPELIEANIYIVDTTHVIVEIMHRTASVGAGNVGACGIDVVELINTAINDSETTDIYINLRTKCTDSVADRVYSKMLHVEIIKA